MRAVFKPLRTILTYTNFIRLVPFFRVTFIYLIMEIPYLNKGNITVFYYWYPKLLMYAPFEDAYMHHGPEEVIEVFL